MHTERTEKSKCILVVDDDSDSAFLIKQLVPPDITVYSAENGLDGIRLAQEINPSLIVLDINMPKLGGIETCRLLRSNDSTKNIPVIMLSASSEVDSKVDAFMRGADDYVSKSADNRELQARISAKLRRVDETRPPMHRQARKGSPAISCGGIELNEDRFEVKICGKNIDSSVLEFKLLKHFINNPGRVFSRRQLLDSFWKNTVVTPRTVDTHVSTLRKKIEGAGYVIKSIYGAGYIFSAESTDCVKNIKQQSSNQ
ncbi:MAG: hypothetical protein A2583_01370 [Bdellovibrionales bacterium RIFOXYD1_FULL_53_11]|nr:MAG: hypothetical protein A2583_01370 [Bdellovibrionales bacterium RIFOXYD1_FULL_53_11]